MKISYRVITVKVLDLKQHEFLKEFDFKPNEIYEGEAKYFQYYDKPVIIDGCIVLTHWEEVITAKNIGLEKMQVVEADGLQSDDILRFINFRMMFKNISRKDKYKMIQKLESHLRENPKGKEWAKELYAHAKGKHIVADINGQIGLITNYDHETIKLFKRIGKADPLYFENDDLSLKDIVTDIERNKTLKERQKDEKEVTEGPPINPPSSKPAELLVTFEDKKRHVYLNLETTDLDGTLHFSKQTEDGLGKIELTITNPKAFELEFSSGLGAKLFVTIPTKSADWVSN